MRHSWRLVLCVLLSSGVQAQWMHSPTPGIPRTREGLLASQWVEGEAPHPRKYYTLTRAGAKRLSDMKVQWRAFAEKIDRLIAAAERG